MMVRGNNSEGILTGSQSITFHIGAETPLGTEPLRSELAESRTQGTKAEFTLYPEGLHSKPPRDMPEPTKRETLDPLGAETG